MPSRVTSPILVGRRRELDRLTAALVVVAEGHPAFFLVSGEAGVGKTRFVREVTTRAATSGARVLEGGCVPFGGERLPFGPIVEAFRDIPQTFSPSDLDEMLGAGSRDLARLVPGLPRVHDETRSGLADNDPGQGQLFEHVLGFLRRLAGAQPIVVVVEDIHWADRSTLELLAFLARNLREGSILVLASYRSDELHRDHPLRPFLVEQERARRFERVELNRFDRSELADQLAAILGAPADAELVGGIMGRSEGNAFYAEELLAAKRANGGVADSLRDVVMARVASLSQPTQALVRVAAAGGTRVSPTLLARVSGTPMERLEVALREAIDRYILASNERHGDDRYVFRHALVQEVLYQELLPGERVRLHARFARALAAARGSDGIASRAAELGYHWQAAGDLPRAFDAWIEAGIAAEAIYAEAEAREDFEHALDLWDRVSDAATRAPFDRVDLLMHAALHAEGPEPSRSVAYVREAIGLVDIATDPQRAGLLHERLGQYSLAALDETTALAAYREGVRLVPAAPDSSTRSWVLSGLGRCYADIYRPAEAVAACREALAVARAAGAKEVETRALVPLGHSLVLLGEVEAGLATLQHARQVATELGAIAEVAGAWAWFVGSLLDAGRFEEAAAAGLEAEGYASLHGLGARWAPGALFYRAAALFHLGNWDEATETLTRARQYELPGPVELNVDAQWLLIEALQGRFASANRRAARVRELAEKHRSWFTGALPQLALSQGDLLTVRQDVETILGDPGVRGRQVGWPVMFGLAAEAEMAALARSRLDESELGRSRARGAALIARMRLAARVDSARLPVFRRWLAAQLATCEAEFARLQASPEPDLWAAAARAWLTMNIPYHAAYALMREGEATLELRHNRRRAARALTIAFDIADRLGALPLKQVVEDLAQRANIVFGQTAIQKLRTDGTESLGARHHPTPAAPRGRHDLTSREREVLELLTVGYSNVEIGQRLFISRKTVSVHVATIKGKLGARSRVEIATDAIDLGLINSSRSETHAEQNTKI